VAEPLVSKHLRVLREVGLVQSRDEGRQRLYRLNSGMEASMQDAYDLLEEAAIERDVRARGALSMSLHVFARNTRARAVYERAGYSGELMRYIKHFS
jgi:DNA-binding transcriptional ArsR family regulator